MAEVNLQRLQEVFEHLKESMGAGLLSADIFDKQNLVSLIGFNSNPVACALFGKIYYFINEAAQEAGFPPMNRYYLIDLKGDKAVVVVDLHENYLLGMLIDLTKVQIGVLLSVVIPRIIKDFNERVVS
ncbi:MAG: hypothetical protein GXO29_05635 [Thermotogae bacterium]|nr:hypothetical protein [Thermotogota bacterium]